MLRSVFLQLPRVLLALLLLSPSAVAQDLSDLSVAELLEIDVTSVSKKEQKLSEAAAAVHVITQEDIRRSGVTAVPELFRGVPGMEVARIDGNRWAVAVRGFNDQFSTNLLVLMDGRTLYTPLFSGVLWDARDTLLEDIEQIEIIRGPGATLWGANAVNGVINIITKNAIDTNGLFVEGGGGKEENGFASLRYGAQLGEDTDARAYFKWNNRDDNSAPLSGDSGDAWQSLRGGFRIDSFIGDENTVTLQGDVYHLSQDRVYFLDPSLDPFLPEFPGSVDHDGGNIQARWVHTFEENSNFQLQAYYDFEDRDDGFLSHERDTFDLEAQFRFQPVSRHDVILGAGYRFSTDSVNNNRIISFDPESEDLDLYTAFIQDDITLIEEQLHLIIGSKFEQNFYTDFEFMPNIRLVYTPKDGHTLWGAVSRAVRTPSRGEEDSIFLAQVLPPGFDPRNPLATIVEARGTSADSLELIAYEAGYRGQLAEDLSLDLATYFFSYRNLFTLEPGMPSIDGSVSPPVLVAPLFIKAGLDIESHGVEVAVKWDPVDWWRLQGSMTYISLSTFGGSNDSGPEGSGDFGFTTIDQDSPDFQFAVSSYLDLPGNIEFDARLRHVEETRPAPQYAELDLRLGWNPSEEITLSLVGTNLLDNSRQEWFENQFGQPLVEIDRAIYARVTLNLGS